MTPNFFGYLQHELELFGLVIERDRIPCIIAREAALRAQAEAIQVDIFGGGIDTPLNLT